MREKPGRRRQHQEEEHHDHDHDDDDLHGQQEEEEVIRVLDLDRLKVMGPVGRGAKGVVFHVRRNPGEQDLALKVVSKATMTRRSRKISKNDIDGVHDDVGGSTGQRRVSFEQQVLRRFRHPLLPRLRGVLMETDEVVGYAIDYCPGGDLNSLRRQHSEKMFSDDAIRFYGAELVLALEYLHRLGIVYRDLKPENILIQSDGHLMLVDFDLATQLLPRPSPAKALNPSTNELSQTRILSKLFRCYNPPITPDHSDPAASTIGPDSARSTESDSSGKSNSFVGTEEYVAPEMIKGCGHDFSVDWWCLGVVLYEMLYGATPFRGSNRKETFYKILTKSPELVGEATPLRDLIRRLLEKDPPKRISLEEIKGHDFFKGIDWELILRLSRPPFIPGQPEAEDEDEGIRRVDVEKIVRGIFGYGQLENKKKNHNGEGSGTQRRPDHIHGAESHDFSVF